MIKEPVVLDTNVLIAALAKKEPYSSFLRKLVREKRLVFSSIVIAGLLSGADDEEEKVFLRLAQNLPVLPINLNVARLPNCRQL
jgi:predicted nucleic acid-binding protein